MLLLLNGLRVGGLCRLQLNPTKEMLQTNMVLQDQIPSNLVTKQKGNKRRDIGPLSNQAKALIAQWFPTSRPQRDSVYLVLQTHDSAKPVNYETMSRYVNNLLK